MSETQSPMSEKLFFGVPTAVLVPYKDQVNSGDSEADNESIDKTDKGSKENPFINSISNKRPAADEVLPTKRQKRLKRGTKVNGGVKPSFKPITVDLDEEDQIIVDMKQQGYKDEVISERLALEGLTRYEPGSVACRWLRIRKKTREYEEKLLDEQLTDWHVEEDNLLGEAVEAGNQKLHAELAKLEKLRWSWTAQALNKRLPRERFSANACKDRWEAKMKGTARCPPELDADPESRALEREQRAIAYKQRKEDEARLEAAAAAEKKRSKKDNTVQRVAARQRRETQDALKAQKKKDENEYRQAKAEVATHAKQRRQDAIAAARSLRAYQVLKDKFFKKLHKQLKGEMAALLREKEKNGGNTPKPDDKQKLRSRYTYKNTADQILNENMKNAEAALNARASEFTGVVQAVGIVTEKPMTLTKPSEFNANSSQQPATPGEIFAGEPRNMCTLDELYNILRSRGMLLNRMKENKSVIVSRLNNEDRICTALEIKDLLKARNEDLTGTKDELIQRLAVSDAKSSRRFQTKYTPRPLDDNGNRTRVKMPLKPAVTQTTKRYNAREVAIEDGKAVAKKQSPVTGKKRAVANKSSAKKTNNKDVEKNKFIPDENEDDSELEIANKIDKSDVKDVVSKLLPDS
ncbi:hypothetical protein E4T47_04440 [Aureobasidium subglaciale]|nr:hypothetical protein E4T47_04440 [Aureobasidium subglaciale]